MAECVLDTDHVFKTVYITDLFYHDFTRVILATRHKTHAHLQGVT